MIRQALKCGCALGVYLLALAPAYERGWEDALRAAHSSSTKETASYNLPVIEQEGRRYLVDVAHQRLLLVREGKTSLERILEVSRNVFDHLTPREALDTR